MTPEEKFNLGRFIQAYVQVRLELMTKNAIESVENLTIRDDYTISLEWQITLTGVQLKAILSGELDPYVAVKIMTPGPRTSGGYKIRLDKEPNGEGTN